MYCFYNEMCLSATFSRHASNLEISIFSGRKVNLVSTFGRSKFKIPSSFRKRREKQKKSINFYAKLIFEEIYLIFVV